MIVEGLNKWSTLISNAAVIAGIVFLAYELNQNNENLEAQSKFNYLMSRGEANLQNAHDPVFAEIIIKAGSNVELTPVEQTQLDFYFRYMFVGWEWAYGESLRGRSELSAVNIQQFFGIFPRARELWPTVKQSYARPFREFVDNDVLLSFEPK